jgi:uncharacterized protein (TIGR03437 family)
MVRLLALLLAPGILCSQMQLAPGALGSLGYYPSATSATVSLRPVGAATPIPAQVVSVAAGNVNFVVPADMPLGAAEIIYKVSGMPTQWTPAVVVPANFTISAVQIVGADGVARANTLSQPAQPGESVVIWGSGLGMNPATLGVAFGGAPQNILYAGPAPGLPGVNQINFQVGSSAPDGCYQPVTVSLAGGSATAWLSKSSSGGPCPHPWHLSASDLATLDAGGSIAVGDIYTASNVVAVSGDHASREENAAVSFAPWDANAFAAAFEGSTPETGGYPEFPVGNQTLSATNVSEGVTLTTNDDPLANLPAPVFAGPSVWSNSGGSFLAPSSFAFNLPAPILVQGSPPLAWSSAKDQTITWNPPGFDSGAVLQATLYGTNGTVGLVYSGYLINGEVFSVAASEWFAGSGVTVSAPASAGTLTFPAQMISQIGPGAATLIVQVTEPYASVPSTLLKQTSGKTLLMIVTASTSETIPVDIQ